MRDWLETDLARHEREEEAYEAALPECDCCGDKIHSEYAWSIEGGYYCEDCAEDWFEAQKMRVEVLMDD